MNLVYDPDRKFIDLGDACPSYKSAMEDKKKKVDKEESLETPLEEVPKEEKQEELPFASLKATSDYSEVFSYRHKLFSDMKQVTQGFESSKYLRTFDDFLKKNVMSDTDVLSLK